MAFTRELKKQLVSKIDAAAVYSSEIRFAGLKRTASGHVVDGDPVVGARAVNA
jgi:hypothetical protein